MSPANLHSRRVRRDEGGGDPVVCLVRVTEQAFGVIQPECEAEDGGHGRQRNISLVPAKADTDDLLAVELALAHITLVRYRGRV